MNTYLFIYLFAHVILHIFFILTKLANNKDGMQRGGWWLPVEPLASMTLNKQTG
jgi:hypothetical protein